MDRSSTLKTSYYEVKVMHALVLLWGGLDDLLQVFIVYLQHIIASQM
jgi:hypothetical protein